MNLHINGKQIEVADSLADKRLIDFLREDLELTGTKNACDIGACGACTILLDNKPHRTCLLRVQDVRHRHILTIEGLSPESGAFHPLQQAFIDSGAIQCGFCTPGMVLIAHAFLLQNPEPSRDEVRRAIAHNLCRCTGYQQIINAIEHASTYYRREPATELEVELAAAAAAAPAKSKAPMKPNPV